MDLLGDCLGKSFYESLAILPVNIMDKAAINLDDYNELTGKIIGCAMQVHRVLGQGFQEVIYQRALAIELEQTGIPAQRELEMPIYYRDREIG